ncbi:DUF1385 domain-containing protein [Candidatus Peregrinibacteria bacterium]|jgi:uncharacterized protein YqhQ|nr:DUF1385 domain-containing protein [Candidatus Peregrinibacteria bacterium]
MTYFAVTDKTIYNPAMKIDFAVGGQAVIEGVMMRSPHFYTVAVRDEEGEIKMKQEKFTSLTERFRILKLPLLRGIVHLVESMSIGFKSLNYSNDVFLGEDEKEEVKHGMAKTFLFAAFSALYLIGTLAFTLFLLKVLPLWIAEKAAEFLPIVEENYILFNLIDGASKIVIFLSYIILISLLKDIRRVFQYHGAEHKSIWAYEKGLELNVENARKQTRFHPRCGTSFIFIVILMSIVIYTVFPPADTFLLKLGQRLAVIPLIAGISYEALKFSAKHQQNILVRAFSAPGLMIQGLTTREPDDKQLEIALHSLKESLKVEKDLVL